MNRGVGRAGALRETRCAPPSLAPLATLDALTSCFLRVARVSLRPPPAFPSIHA